MIYLVKVGQMYIRSYEAFDTMEGPRSVQSCTLVSQLNRSSMFSKAVATKLIEITGGTLVVLEEKEIR